MEINRFYRGNEKSEGIELFRIVSMLMIIVLHINLCGGLMGCFGQVDSKYITLWFGESSCFCCVNCFAIISGYVMAGRKLKPSKVLSTWFQVFSISAIIAGIFYIWFSEGVEPKKITDGFQPLLKSQYWYFTAYFGMMFFIPVMNAGIENIPRKTFKKCLIIIIFLFTIVTTYERADLFRHSNGMSTFWLCVMYLIGGYFGKNGIDTKKYSMKKSALYSILCAVIISAWIIIHSYNISVEQGAASGQWDYLYYTNPVVVLQSIFMLMFFAQVKINNKTIKKIIMVLGASSFSVYLIHVQPLIFDLVFRGSFKWLEEYNFFVMGLLVILCAVGIYIACTILDNIRLFILRLCNINHIVKQAGELLNNIIDTIIAKL